MAKGYKGSANLLGFKINSVTNDENNSRIRLAVRDLLGKQGITLQTIIQSPMTTREVDLLKGRMKRLDQQSYDLLVSDKKFKRDDLSGQKYAQLAKRVGKGNIQEGYSILDEMDMRKIKPFLLGATPEDQKAVLDLLGTRTAMGYKRGVQKSVSVEDILGGVKQKEIKTPTPRKPKKTFKDRVKEQQKEREEAPYGRKKDGTPKQKPGRKPKTKEQRDLEKAVDKVVDKFPPGAVNEPKLKDNLEKATENLNDYVDWYNDEHPDQPIKIGGSEKPTPEDVAEFLDNSPSKIEDMATDPPKPGEQPKDILEEAIKERKEKPIKPEEVLRNKNLTPREKKLILEKLESDEDLDPEFLDWLERKLRRRVRPLPPNFDEQNLSPEEILRQAYSHKSDKDKVATENWFKCARIEFGLNIPRLPVLIDLAYRVADQDPNLLFQPRTEINLWYNRWGWQRADDLIDNLESVSGLRADEDIQAYQDEDERNRKIRRWYANKLRYNLRQDLIDQGWTDRKERDKKLAQLMREKGYEY